MSAKRPANAAFADKSDTGEEILSALAHREARATTPRLSVMKLKLKKKLMKESPSGRQKPCSRTTSLQARSTHGSQCMRRRRHPTNQACSTSEEVVAIVKKNQSSPSFIHPNHVGGAAWAQEKMDGYAIVSATS